MRTRSVTLRGLSDVELLDDVHGSTTWEFLGLNPLFGIEGFDRLAPGFYRIMVETPGGWDVLSVPTVSIDTGTGFSESETVTPKLTRRGELACFDLRLPEGAERLRLGLATLAASLTVEKVTIARVSVPTHWARQVGTVVRHRFRDLGQTKRTLSSVVTVLRDGGPRGLVAKMVEKTAEGDPQDPTFSRLPFETFREFAQRQSNQYLNALDGESGAIPGEAALLSLILPIRYLEAASLATLLDSLDDQTTQSFEVVAVIGGAAEAARELVQSHDRAGWSLRCISLPTRGSIPSFVRAGIDAASGSYVQAGIDAASGSYVTVVDPTAVLSRDFVRGFQSTFTARESDICFADEAIVDQELATVVAVHTRGAFDLRFYLCHPYIIHPVFYRTSLIRDAGLLHREADGGESETHDLLMHCLAKAESVTHLPVVAYYRRSAAAGVEPRGAHMSLGDAGPRVRQFLRTFSGWDDVSTETVAPDVLSARVRMSPPAKVAIIVPTKNGLEYLAACVDSVRRTDEHNQAAFDLFVIDHESDDEEVLRYLRSSEPSSYFRTLRYEGPWNFSAINNWAVTRITELDVYSHLVFMNNDIELVTPDWLDRMVELFMYPDVGVVGCCLIYPDEIVQHAGMVIGMSDSADHSHRFHPFYIDGTKQRAPGHMGSLLVTRDYGAVTAALMAVPTDLFLRVGGFDEQLAVTYNDADLCLRIGQLGYASTYNGQVVAIHHESASRGKEPQRGDAKLFRERHREIVERGDPSYGHLMDWNSSRIRYSFQFSDRATLSTTVLDKYRPRSGDAIRGTA